MKILDFLYSRLNKYSVIGSLVYGAICVFSAMMVPEVVSPLRYLIYIISFISACLFYFGMYILYTTRKHRTWPEWGKFILNLVSQFVLGYIAAILIYVILFRVSFDTAITHIANVFYYTPFLP